MSNDKLTDDIIKSSDDTENKNRQSSPSQNNDLPRFLEFPISGKAKSLGIESVTREHNTVVVKIRNVESHQEPFVIRRAINFKDWNAFIRDLRKNISDLRFEFEPKRLNRIIVNIETGPNKNFESLRSINSGMHVT